MLIPVEMMMRLSVKKYCTLKICINLLTEVVSEVAVKNTELEQNCSEYNLLFILQLACLHVPKIAALFYIYIVLYLQYILYRDYKP